MEHAKRGAIFTNAKTAKALGGTAGLPYALCDHKTQLTFVFQQGIGHGVCHEGGNVFFALPQNRIHPRMNKQFKFMP